MQNVSDTAAATPLPRRLLTGYRQHAAVFWRVMLPVIGISIVLHTAMLLSFKSLLPDAYWIFSTSTGVGAESHDSEDPSVETSEDPETGETHSVVRVGSYTTIKISADTPLLLLFVMCPLILIIARQNEVLTARGAWRQTFSRIRAILGVFLLIGAIFAVIVALAVGFFALASQTDFLIPIALIVIVVFGGAAFYFFIKWSLCFQCIMLENRSVRAALRRSSELVKGRWGGFFLRYLLLAWLISIFTALVLGSVLLVFAHTTPEFEPLREALRLLNFLGFFVFHQVGASVETAPMWTVRTMVVASTLVYAVCAPLWVLLTTHLYLEQVKERVEPENAPSQASG